MKLLVSVRNAPEARLAATGGADIIDVKEPRLGSLGAASSQAIQDVIAACPETLPVSVACGELVDAKALSSAPLPLRVSFAKLGLAGCGREQDWWSCLQQAWAGLPEHVEPVMVAYADWREAGAPPPEEVIRCSSGTTTVFLLDTFTKTGSIRERWPTSTVSAWLEMARANGFRVVLAGSLRIRDLRHVAQYWRPDIVAVRGAACVGPRESMISQKKVAGLKSALCRQAHLPSRSPSPTS